MICNSKYMKQFEIFTLWFDQNLVFCQLKAKTYFILLPVKCFSFLLKYIQLRMHTKHQCNIQCVCVNVICICNSRTFSIDAEVSNICSNNLIIWIPRYAVHCMVAIQSISPQFLSCHKVLPVCWRSKQINVNILLQICIKLIQST